MQAASTVARPRVGVIGAGPSGLTAAKKLLDAGLAPLVFEQNEAVGGNWLFSPEPGHSSVFEGTHIISSKRFSQYADYPMPADWPDYPSRRLLIEYFQGYARRFELERHIRFRTRVLRCEPRDGGGWRVTTDGAGGAETHDFEHLLVANGHHWHPRWPTWPGRFDGRLMHAHEFKSARGFEGRRVLVVGGGNSACDCAVEIARVAEFTALSLRRGYWFLPKFMLGQPNDVLYARLLFLPPRLRQALMRAMHRLLVGPFARYGLPEPEHDVLEAHPTLNSELLERLRHGDVAVRADVERLDGSRVVFRDARAEAFDTIVACTGYEIRFPFLDPALVDYSTGEVPLWLRVFHPTLRGLYFIGLVQPLGCIWPLSELQSELVAAVITGRTRLPGDLAARAHDEPRRRPFDFMATPRHSLEVDYHDYRGRLLRALRAA
jgi:cation diffusion facilitator CzcD-associated flavoprotein CzcO